MSDFILAMVTIVYALVCLTKKPDQGKCSKLKYEDDPHLIKVSAQN
jgi:hypothetical protein